MIKERIRFLLVIGVSLLEVILAIFISNTDNKLSWFNMFVVYSLFQITLYFITLTLPIIGDRK